jgi:ubiquinone/menaquinone biosynthesis C-methylase UbiE
MGPSQEAFQQWTAVAPAWASYRDRLFEEARPVSEWLVDRIDPQPGQTVLEVTAGPGETGFLAARRLGPEGRLISSDFVPGMVEAAARGAADQGLTNVDCRLIDVQDIDLPDGSVDSVLSRFGLMLVPEQERAVAEIRRVKRDAGRFAFATWAAPDRNPWLFHIVAALMQNGVAPPGDPFAPGGVFSLSTVERTQDLMAGAGATDITAEELSGVMHFDGVDDYWSFNTALAGPLAAIVSTLDDEQLRSVRATLDPSMQQFDRGGTLEVPWTAVVTSAT